MSKRDGGPAFPCSGPAWTSTAGGHDVRTGIAQGMSLRDYIATHALAALIGQLSVDSAPVREMLVEEAYIYADEMLKARGDE